MRSQAFFSALLGATVLGSVVASSAPAGAAVYPPQQVLAPQAIQQFLADPKALLSQFPNGGPEMIARIRDLAASDPATLNALIGLLSSANPDQATAIGTALGDVAKLAVGNDPDYAAQIQVAIALANNSSASVAFNAVIGGDIQIAAAGGGGGGGGGPTTPFGAGGGFTGGGSTPNFNTSTTNTPDSFTQPSLSGSSPGSVSP